MFTLVPDYFAEKAVHRSHLVEAGSYTLRCWAHVSSDGNRASTVKRPGLLVKAVGPAVKYRF